MDKKQPVVGLIAGAVLIGGLEIEFLEIRPPDVQQKIVQESSSREQLVFGRSDHGPEEWPHAPVTYQGVATMITTIRGGS